MVWKSRWGTGPGICQIRAQRRKEGHDARPPGPLNQESESESARKAARFYSTLSWNRGRLFSYLSLSTSRNVFSFLSYWPKSSYGPDTGWALKYLFNKWKNEEEPALESGYFLASRSSSERSCRNSSTSLQMFDCRRPNTQLNRSHGYNRYNTRWSGLKSKKKKKKKARSTKGKIIQEMSNMESIFCETALRERGLDT